MHPGLTIAWIWGIWLVSWMLAAGWSNRSTKRALVRAELSYLLTQGVGTYVLVLSGMRRWRFEPQFWNVGEAGGWAMAVLVLVGLAFAWWARLALGKLWSGNVARKAEHRIIETGPYALTRHPIYTGILFSMFATGAAIGRPMALLGVALITIGLWMKARLEERFLRMELGATAYDEYARRTPMLIPFLR
ncbi:MAG: isoprenylcysteine carboxylmethyltransferase family protein [Alphaproteobacteria bacterium]